MTLRLLDGSDIWVNEYDKEQILQILEERLGRETRELVEKLHGDEEGDGLRKLIQRRGTSLGLSAKRSSFGRTDLSLGRKNDF